MLKIAIAQLDPVVGAFEANFQKIKEAYLRACSIQARICLTSELAICGYPPYDLMDRPEMFEQTEKILEKLTYLTQNQSCALVVGHVSKNEALIGRFAQNCVSVLEKGECVFRQAKTLLPTYDIFDEARYFEPAQAIRLWQCDQIQIGIAICEDLWGDAVGEELCAEKNGVMNGVRSDWRQLYAQNPVRRYQDLGAQLLLVAAASPYALGKVKKRQILHANQTKKLKIPLIYVNQVGATDEVLFDGASFAVNALGQGVGQLSSFQTDFGMVTYFDPEKLKFSQQSPVGTAPEKDAELETLEKALVCGIREYWSRTGFKKALLGLSGGIDSAVVACLAAKALGPENVCGIAMPSQYSASQSLMDAESLAKNLGIAFEVRPIKFLFSMAMREIAGQSEGLADIALENLQSRLRGTILMTLSNHRFALVLSTGNKSELAMGYCTLYGDMVGALAPIGDLYKTQVYELAHYLNQSQNGQCPIPENTIIRAPTAELKPNQTDQDTLPAYDLLDALLFQYLEQGLSVVELEKQFAKRLDAACGGSTKTRLSTVTSILRQLELNEYKRRQAPPVLKVSAKAFGIGRKVPVAKRWV